MLCAPLDWKYAELPSSASDAVLCSVLVRKLWDKYNQIERKKRKNSKIPCCWMIMTYTANFSILVLRKKSLKQEKNG